MNNSEKIEATKSLTKLFGSFPQSPMSDPDLQLRAYLEAVEDFECVDVLAAVERFRQGEVKDANKAFCPSTAQLCDEVRYRRQMREIMARAGVKPAQNLIQ
ncbi:hypothetical protein DEV91_1151 [Phyllobacterium brassicacearum]|nr:hypothetical protein DEV91_1151 [Phyllobacterium brassicacearum]